MKQHRYNVERLKGKVIRYVDNHTVTQKVMNNKHRAFKQITPPQKLE